jgi:UDP:flavonoid glycosyltransferase YjiC (YdhE family)
MLVVPFGFDQPDNAARVARLGVARMLPRLHYNVALATSELKALLNGEEYMQKATEIARQVQADNGAKKACDAMETLLDKQSGSRK